MARSIATNIGDLVGNDQIVLSVNGDLDVETDSACAFATGGHRACVRIGERDLLVGRSLHLACHLSERPHLSPQAFNFFRDPSCLAFGHVVVLTVSAFQSGQIAGDAGLDLFDALGNFVHREVFVTVIHGFEFAAVYRHDGPREQVQLTAQHNELRAGSTDRWSVVTAEIDNVLKSGIKRPVSHISSILHCVSRSSRRLD